MSIPIRFIDGREFPSLSAAAEAAGISSVSLWRRLELGQYPFSDIMPDRGRAMRRPCYFRGKVYPSRTEAAKAHGVSVSAVIRAVRRQRKQG